MEYERISDSIYKMTTAGPTGTSLLIHSGSKPKLENDKSDFEPCFDMEEIIVNTVNEKTVIQIPLESDEKLYGLGLRFLGIEQTKRVVKLEMDHFANVDNGRTHAPTPFYLSDKGYGIFVDTAKRTSFYMGNATRIDAKNPPPIYTRTDSEWDPLPRGEYVEISFDTANTDIYIIFAPTLKEIISKFNLLCGGGCLPPKWSLGFWHRSEFTSNQENILNEVEDFCKNDFKLDVLGLEPGWHSGAYPCTYMWNEELFPNPEKMTETLKNKGVHINLWENPYISPNSEIYKDMLPYSGSHLVWNGIVPDYTLETPREILKAQHKKQHVDIGISGYKIDEVDGKDAWLWPDHSSFPSKIGAIELRQMYGTLMQRTISELYEKENIRTFGLVRGTNAGACPYPFALYNDCYKFDEYLCGIVTSGFIGALWVPEIREANDEDEWVRRFQMALFSPIMMLNGWASGTKPWSFPNVSHIIRSTISLRYQLTPYVYNSFYLYYTRGVPPFRALCTENKIQQSRQKAELDSTDNPYEETSAADISDQYYMGESLMVAPMMPHKTSRTVIIPNGDWYDFYTKDFVGTQTIIDYQCSLEKTPVFVRNGSMIFMNDEKEKDTLLVKCYGDKGVAEFYDDDGETYDYKNGKYNLIKMSFEKINNEIIGHSKIIYNNYNTQYKKIKFI